MSTNEVDTSFDHPIFIKYKFISKDEFNFLIIHIYILKNISFKKLSLITK